MTVTKLHIFSLKSISEGDGVKFNKSLLNETGGFNEPANMGWMTFFLTKFCELSSQNLPAMGAIDAFILQVTDKQ